MTFTCLKCGTEMVCGNPFDLICPDDGQGRQTGESLPLVCPECGTAHELEADEGDEGPIFNHREGREP